MCGISIVIHSKDCKVDNSVIRAMNNAIEHRGPDDEGYYFGGNFALGHRRLSILDLSSAGHQPMRKEKYIISYNGEVYNYIELREELKLLGHSFHSGTDTEVILSAFAQWGTACFEKFNGMWSFALYDEVNNRIVFCRDHFGIKPLYFTRSGDLFLAGSEIKQFCKVEGFQPVLNKCVAVNFLVNGLLNYSDQSFFEGVQELRPGHYLEYNLDTHQYVVVKWYDLAKASVSQKLDEKSAIAELRRLFFDSVRIRMRSDVRVGSCLSGGIDSSAIVTTVHTGKMANEDFATITSCYKDKNFDEQEFSDAVSSATGFKAVKVFPELNDFWDLGHLDKMLYHQDQPFSSASHYSEFNVFKTAHENSMIVMLDGQGSDEYLCGYVEFFIVRISQLLKEGKWRDANDLVKHKAVHNKRLAWSEWKAFFKTNTFYPLLGRLKMFGGRNNVKWLSAEWQKIAKEGLLSFSARTIRTLSIEEMEYTSIPYQLHSEDRNSMLFSIESRLPFLCPRLVEFVIGLPDNFKLKDGYTKYVLRKAIPEMPEKIRERKDKMGFVAPDAPWMKQNREMVRKELEEAIQHSGIFNQSLLEQFDDFIEGKREYEPLYFRVMAFNRFCKIFKLQVN
jgi:asparagine synthase (glutamine-hydrolysing)